MEEGRIKPSLAVSIDGEVARMGLLEKVGPGSEVHFVPAIAGGNGAPGQSGLKRVIDGEAFQSKD